MDPCFNISYEASHVTVTPIRKVARAAVASALLTHPKLFVSSECPVDYGLLLFAHAQDATAKSRKIVALERLEGTLYAVLQVERLPLAEINSKPEATMADAEGLVPVDSDDWWKTLEASDADVESAILLDLGLQPLPELPAEAVEESLEDFLQSITTLYYNTLYGSKAPLVFFAKSSLPRMRKTILARDFSEQRITEHILNHVLPQDAKFDAKYKTFIPTYVKGEMVGLPVQYDTACLQEGEQGHIQNWLESCIAATAQPRPDTVLSSCLMPLKTREAQIMVLLLLELLTFAEPSKAIELRIDLLLDRLAIWQTITFSQEDPLKSFCLEIILPYYAARLPDMTTTIQLKCVPQDLLAFEPPATPARAKKRVRMSKPIATSTVVQASVSLKRTLSAPANLLSEKKAVPKKRSLGREVSMTKKVPSFQLAGKSSKNQASRTVSFEQRRRQRVEQEARDRIQVGATPAKPTAATVALQQAQKDAAAAAAAMAAQFHAQHASKADFMSIVETPSKEHAAKPSSGGAVGETPLVGLKTPTRRATLSRTRTPARQKTVLDTPSAGNAASLPLFNIASPTAQAVRPRHLFSADAGASKRSSALDMGGAPGLQKTQSLPMMPAQDSPFTAALSGDEAGAMTSSPVADTQRKTAEQPASLHEALDWL